MALIFILLYAPIVTLVVLSFNDSKTRAKWGGFYPALVPLTVCQYRDHECAVYDTDHRASCLCDCDCAWNACVHRHQQHVEKEPDGFHGITNIPMLNGEIVMGISLMRSLSSPAFSLDSVPF